MKHECDPVLLVPDNCALILLDHQPQLFFGVHSHDKHTLINNVIALAKSAKAFNIPTVLSTINAEKFSGAILPGIQSVFPDIQPIDRTILNAWENNHFVQAVKNTGRKKLIFAGVWTEVSLLFPALCALAAGYEVYCVVDACGGTSLEAHNTALQRLLQAGMIPITWLQFLLELQRDWSRPAVYEEVLSIAKEHAGAYGLGILYAKTMVAGEGKK